MGGVAPSGLAAVIFIYNPDGFLSANTLIKERHHIVEYRAGVEPFRPPLA
jgi:hypothetical protein